MRVQQSIMIKASPDKVFAYLMDIKNRRNYIPALEEVILLDPLPLQVGSRYTEIAMIAGRKFATTYQIFKLEENKLIAARTLKSVFPIEARLGLLNEDDFTVLSINLEFKLSGLFRLASGIIRGIVNQQALDILNKVKRQIEH